MLTTGLHHIALRASNFDKTVTFYTEGLGFKKKISWGELGKRAIMLDVGDGCCIEIFEGGTVLPEDNYLSSIGKWIHIAIKTSDARAMYKRALEAGATISSEPNDLTIESEPQKTPVTIAFVFGLDGELIEFFQER